MNLFWPETSAGIRAEVLAMRRQSKTRRILRCSARIFSATLLLALMKRLSAARCMPATPQFSKYSECVMAYKHPKPFEPAMSIHTFSSRAFARDVSAAKRAAADGPVFTADRERPAFALLKIDDYHRLSGKAEETRFDLMSRIPGGDGIEFDPPRMKLVTQEVKFDQLS